MRTRVLTATALSLMLFVRPAATRGDAAPPDARSTLEREVAVLASDAFHAAYNLDEPRAFAAARRAVAVGPEEPAAHRTLASILWMAILFRRGAVVSDNFLTGSLKSQTMLPRPPADLDAEFQRELTAAIDLADARLRKDPDNIEAHYDVGTAYALKASYVASVEGSGFGAMRLAKRAYDAQEYVLSHDPSRVDAGLVVGTYRYLVSTFGLPTRLMAYLIGFGGGKERGIRLIEAAARAADTHADAKVALLLIYDREHRYADAARLATELEHEFPENRFFTLEAGSALTRADQAAEGQAALTRGLAAFEADARPKIPGERAIWLYKRAVARIALGQLPGARADLDAARRSGPVGWARGRIELETGKVDDLTGRRTDAVSAYQRAKALCALRDDSGCTKDAGRLIQQPFQ